MEKLFLQQNTSTSTHLPKNKCSSEKVYAKNHFSWFYYQIKRNSFKKAHLKYQVTQAFQAHHLKESPV